MVQSSKRWLALAAMLSSSALGCSAPVASPGAIAVPPKPESIVVAQAQTPTGKDLPKKEAANSPTKRLSFAFPADSGGKLLAETLVPTAPALPLPYVDRPRVARPLEMERAGSEGVWLVPIAPLEPRGLMPPAASGKSRPQIDVPVLATGIELPLPALPPFPTAPRAYAPSSDPERVPPLPALARPMQSLPLPGIDPTADASLAVLLSSVATGRAVPAPPILLEIPDPYRLARSMELRGAPPESAPAYAPTSAPRPSLPVDPPKPAETKPGGG